MTLLSHNKFIHVKTPYRYKQDYWSITTLSPNSKYTFCHIKSEPGFAALCFGVVLLSIQKRCMCFIYPNLFGLFHWKWNNNIIVTMKDMGKIHMKSWTMCTFLNALQCLHIPQLILCSVKTSTKNQLFSQFLQILPQEANLSQTMLFPTTLIQRELLQSQTKLFPQHGTAMCNLVSNPQWHSDAYLWKMVVRDLMFFGQRKRLCDLLRVWLLVNQLRPPFGLIIMIKYCASFLVKHDISWDDIWRI